MRLRLALMWIRRSPQVTNIAWTCPNATNSDTVSTSLTTCMSSFSCRLAYLERLT